MPAPDTAAGTTVTNTTVTSTSTSTTTTNANANANAAASSRRSGRRKPDLNIDTAGPSPPPPPPPPRAPERERDRERNRDRGRESERDGGRDEQLRTPARERDPDQDFDRGYDRDRNRDRDRGRDDLHEHLHGLPRTPSDCSPRTSRALRVPDGGPGTGRDGADIETFLEGLTPVDLPPIDMPNTANERPEPPHRPTVRDSHDLSLSPRQVTRDSLVANMLLSLDQLSMSFGPSAASASSHTHEHHTYAGDDHDRALTLNSSYHHHHHQQLPRPSRSVNEHSHNHGHGHGHGHSYSSDYEGTDDASRISPRDRRRSNSGPSYHQHHHPTPGLGRINSLREVSQRSPGRQLHSRGGKGSKSSSMTSVDAAGGYAQVIGSQRWAKGIGRRSSSFDGETRSSPAPWQLEFAGSFLNDNFDAAPTPTIPGGPRKLTTAPSMPVMPVMAPPEPKADAKSSSKGSVPERRRSTRSSRSATLGRKAEPKFNTLRDAPPLLPDHDAAPAPHIGYGKSKDPVPSSNGVPQAKEKQGFFRRMFGSSKSAVSSPVTTPQIASFPPHKLSATPPPTSSRDGPMAQQATTHTLQKKTSSFFRRRKPSMTDSEPPPIPMAPSVRIPAMDRVEALSMSMQPEPSPITSLRRAMDPFLQGSPIQGPDTGALDSVLPSIEPHDVHDDEMDDHNNSPKNNNNNYNNSSGKTAAAAQDEGRTPRGFSPDYEPSPKAVIRKVDPEDHHLPAVATPSRAPVESSPMESPPKSFLRDNSDSEDGQSPMPKRKTKSNKTTPRPAEPRENSNKTLKPGIGNGNANARADGRTRSLSPAVSKSKSVPNLNKAARLSVRTSETRQQQQDQLPPPPLLLQTPRRDSNTLGVTPEVTTVVHSVPSLRVDSAEGSPKGSGKSTNADKPATQPSKSIDEPEIVIGEPTEDERQKAQQIYDGNEDFIQKDRAAAWMGEEGIVRQRTLRAYMELYDLEGQSVVASLRMVCQRLLLRAETQQVDRILIAFSKRWCACNVRHGFKSSDVIHTICYSIILLNTDLHMADIEHKMTRSQFIKNTMTTIRQAVLDSAPDAFERPSILPGKGGDADVRTSDEFKHNSFRASFIKPAGRPTSAIGVFTDSSPADTCGPLVKAPFDGPIRAWETQVEIVLKDIYASIRDDRLPLFGAENTPQTPSGLSVMGMLKRSPSVLSKAPSEGVASTRGRVPAEGSGTTNNTNKANSSRWNSKSRSRPRGFNTGFSSSRTSFEDANSVWTPTDSSATWSKLSLGRTHTSMSMDSFGSSYPRGDFQQSIGFANALSQAIIREDSALEASATAGGKDEVHVPLKSEQLLDDESLELAGPPWIKEGIVTHKHHLDGIDKRARDRNWTEVFAVIQKGQLSLFSFSPNKSARHKNRRGLGASQLPKGAVVGGGNWQDNATSQGTFSLRQTLASALPPPGYSRARPHVWALSLPTGAVHLFQVGTPEICKEFVNTANYWSARLSTHPLVGGISNIEYGWSEAIINSAATAAAASESTTSVGGAASNTNRPPSSTKGHSRPGSAVNAAAAAAATLTSLGRSSMQSGRSMRSASFDFAPVVVRPGSGSSGVLGGASLPRHLTGSSSNIPRHNTGGSTTQGVSTSKLPGDRIHITDWTPPTQPTRASPLSESDQLVSLLAYVRSIETELQSHNALRSPMLGAFSPRSGNAARAMANWERKSEYLLRESVKFRTYVEGLRLAAERRVGVYAEREGRKDEGGLGGKDGAGEEEEEVVLGGLGVPGKK
ncbi:uncharacterized protein C8A04DRAFT_25579 [Dichotomopilus funicola]|uniref:SEC7 domain-containing protein n=1 Tax=Dichotomopilus funicola TaxID=1934379 RepID=A0AAN6V870_9PEZI|nr:hypothetical protein C8A04DRAFT_25579 [Dichotomopilus funicola]